MPYLHAFRIYWRPRCHGELEPARHDPRLPVEVNLENHLELSREELALSLDHLVGRPVFFEHMDNHEDYEPLPAMSTKLGLKRESWGYNAHTEQDPVDGSVYVYAQAHDSMAGRTMESALQTQGGPGESSLQHTRDVVRNKIGMNEVSSCARGKRPHTLYLGKQWVPDEEITKQRVAPTTSSYVPPSEMVDLSSLPYVNKGDFENYLPPGLTFRTLQELHTQVTPRCSSSSKSFSPLGKLTSPKKFSPLYSLSSLLSTPFTFPQTASMSVNPKASQTEGANTVDNSTTMEKSTLKEVSTASSSSDTVMVPADEGVPIDAGTESTVEKEIDEEVVPRTVQDGGAALYNMLSEVIQKPEDLERARASVQNLIHQLQLSNGVRAAMDSESKKKLTMEVDTLKKALCAYESQEEERKQKENASFYKEIHSYLTHVLPPEEQSKIDAIFQKSPLSERASMLAPFMRIASTSLSHAAETHKPVPTVLAKASFREPSKKEFKPRPSKRAKLGGAWEGVNFQF